MGSPAALSPAADCMLALIRRNKAGTSFVEISDALRAAGFDPKGQIALPHPMDHNMLMSAGVSDLFVDAFNELLDAHLVHYRPTRPLVYAIDGGALSLPVAQRPPAGGYKELHWIPMVVNDGPAPRD